MSELNTHIIFGGLQTIRVLSIIVLLLPIPLTFRLLIIYIIDALDGNLIYSPFNVNTYEYIYNDKLVDTLLYILILSYLAYYHFTYFGFGIFILFGMLLYRMIGVSRYIITRDKTFIIRYPDMFREFSLILALMYDGYIVKNNLNIVLGAIIVAIFKSYYEYLQHKKNILDIDINKLKFI